jgi:hypothetical protein
MLCSTTMKYRTDSHDIAPYLFVTKKKMRLLIQLIIFNFFGSYLFRILAEVIYPARGRSCDSTFLSASVKIFRKTGNKSVCKVLPKLSFIITLQCEQHKIFPAVTQQIWIIHNSITRVEVLYGVEQINIYISY